ncbi:MAG: hypothetical protein ACI80V_001223 [Rhodothermales bacterium]|jgi:uncharacterized protein YbjT (DUF2867 family)
MKVVLFGATGMVGQAVLRECLLDPDVERVLSVGRRKSDSGHEKLRQFALPDVSDLSSLESELDGLDACMFCLGISSAGMSEEAYTRITFDLTLAVAGTLARLNPGMTFVYVSGLGADSSENGRFMWARVRGRTENALQLLPFKAAYSVRPGVITPLHGITSRTKWTRLGYGLTRPLHSFLRTVFPNQVTTTERLGRAMLKLARSGYTKPILEMKDIESV